MTASPIGVQYRYTALRQDGTTVTGTLAAPSEQGVMDSLARQGLYPIAASRASGPFRSGRAPSVADSAAALTAFAELLDAGLPPLRALQVLRQTAPESWAQGLDAACVSVERGESVANALRNGSLRLPTLVHGLLTAGEAGMGLAAAARQAGGLLERRAALQQSLVSVLAYPAVLAVAGSASLILLVAIVIPRFATILADMHVALPLSTRVVLAAGTAFRNGGPLIGIILMIGVAGFAISVRTADGAQRWSERALRLPLVGPLRWTLASAQAMQALAALLANGVPMSSALEHAAAASGSASVAARLQRCQDAIRSGTALSDALEATGAATPTLVRMARAGEETGRLADMLAHGAALEHRRAEQRVRSLVRLLEPVLILVFGAVIAIVAASLFQAMYAVRPGR